MVTSNNGKYVSMVALQSVLYGVMDPVAKIAYQYMPVYEFLSLRYILSSLVMLLIWKNTILSELKANPVKDYILPGLCMASAFIFSNMALQRTAATNVAFLRSLSVLFAPVLAFYFYHRRISRKDFILFSIMLAGLYLLCAEGGLSSFGMGEVLALIAAALVAGSLVFGQKSLTSVSAVTLSFVQSTVAIMICAGMSIALQSWQRSAEFNGYLILSLVYAALLCTIGGYLLQNTALQHISANLVGIVQCLYPVVAALVSFLLLHEVLSAAGAAGACLILVCTVIKSSMKEQVE